MVLDAGIFVKLVSPGISSILGATFLLLWLYQRQRRYLAVLAVAYFCSAIAFSLQQFTLPIGFAAGKLASNLSFAAAVLCLASAIILSTGRRVPYLGLSLLGAGGLAGFSWFLFVQPDLTWRILSMNFAFGGVALVVASELRAITKKSPTEKTLLALAVICSLNFIVRPLVIVAIHGPYTNYDGFYNSFYWTSLVLSHALLSLMVALCVFGSVALDSIKALRSESHTDPLSGLLNRRGFEEAALAFGQTRGGTPVSLVICDLDHFKAVNDTFGHAAGDRVIRAFADFLGGWVAEHHVAGRIGGEEFAILLPKANLVTARLFAEGARNVFAAMAVEGLPAARRFTASFGVAERRPGETIADLFCRADKALYAAKTAGRDCVRISLGPTATSTVEPERFIGSA